MRIFHFLLYGVVFMLSVTGVISSQTERKKDLLSSESDRADFNAYLRNVLRQADSTLADVNGLWTTEKMPPIAQVLHSKIRGKTKTLQASVHLSVVPKSASLGRCRDRPLVAAIRFSEETAGAEDVEGTIGFEDFKANQRETDSTGIVANLADLRKLGASKILGPSLDEEEASNWGPSLVMDDALSHLGAMAEQEATIFNGKIAVDARIAGVWEGKTSKELGGYMQRIEFKNDCLTAEVTVMGQTLPARISMNCSVQPHRLDIEVIPKGSAVSPPAIPYIFKINGDSLCLCGPEDGAMKRPKSFEGPGLCIMERVGLPEPDPELSAPSPSSEAKPIPPVQPAVVDETMSSLKRWVHEPVVAASLTLAMASTLIALRKSL
eukprot:Skav233903  [mRNA]  locus=scaffold435:359154:370649:+ [translate_table: standard]